MDSHQKVRNEEMLAMIRHGANVVFSAKDSLTTDDDIDEILKKGEKKASSCFSDTKWWCSLISLSLCRLRSWMRR